MKKILFFLFSIITFNSFSQSFFNDNCSSVERFVCNRVFNSRTNAGGTFSATDPALPCGDGIVHNSMWFTVKSDTLANGGTITVTLTAANNLAMAVYTGTCGSLVPVAGACNAGSGTLNVTFNSTPSTLYYVMVDGENGTTDNNFGITTSGNTVQNPDPRFDVSNEVGCVDLTPSGFCTQITNTTDEYPGLTYQYGLIIGSPVTPAPVPGGTPYEFCTAAPGVYQIILTARNGCATLSTDGTFKDVTAQDLFVSVEPSGPFCPEKPLPQIWKAIPNLTPPVSDIEANTDSTFWVFKDCNGNVFKDTIVVGLNNDSLDYNIPLSVCKPVTIEVKINGTCGYAEITHLVDFHPVMIPETTIDRDTACVLDLTSGNPANATVTITNPYAAITNYTWSGPGSFTQGSETTTITNAPTGDNTYYVTVRNELGCTTRDSVMINVRKNPLFDIQLSNNTQTNCYGTGYEPGDTVTFTVTINDGTPRTRVNAIVQLSETQILDTTYTVQSYPSTWVRSLIVGTNPNIIQLTVEDDVLPESSCGRDTSISILILPIPFTANSEVFPLHCENSTDPIELCVTDLQDGTGNFTYNWSGPGTFTNGGQCINVTGLPAGVYNYNVTVADGTCDTTMALSYRIKGAPLIVGDFSTANIRTNCAGEGFLNGDVITYTYTIDSISVPTRVIIDLPGTANDQNFLVNTAPFTGNLTFTYTGTNFSGSIFVEDTLIANSTCKTTFNINIPQLPREFVASASTPQNLYCIRDVNTINLNVQYSINPQNPTYVWTGDNVTTPNNQNIQVSGLAQGDYSYTVQITDNTCDTTLTVDFSVKDAPTLVVDNIRGTTATNCAGTGFVRGTRVTYIFTVDNIIVPGTVVVDLPGTANDRTITVNSVPYTDSASFVVTTATNYGSLSVFDNALASSTCKTNEPLTANPLPQVLGAEYSGFTTICKADNSQSTLTVSAIQGTQPYTYTWSGPNISSQTNLQTSSSIVINVSGLAIGNYVYQVVIADNANCEETIEIPYTVNGEPNIFTQILTAPTTNCAGSGYTAGQTVQIAYGYSDGIIGSQVTLDFPQQTSLNATFNVDESGYQDTIDVVVTANGILGTIAVVDAANTNSQCKGNFTFQVPILLEELTAQTTSATVVCKNDFTSANLPQLVVTGNNGVQPYSFNWTGQNISNQTNTSTSSTASIDVMALNPGTYNYQVTINDNASCEQIIDISFVVTGEPILTSEIITTPFTNCVGTGYQVGQTVQIAYSFTQAVNPAQVTLNFPQQTSLNTIFNVNESTYQDTLDVIVTANGILGTLTVVDASNTNSMCKGDFIFQVPILQAVLAASPKDTTICGITTADNVEVCVFDVQNAQGNLTYLWTSTHQLPADVTTSCISVNGLNIGNSYDYNILITDAATGCDTTVTYQVNISAEPNYVGNFVTTQNNICGQSGYCPGQNVDYQFTVSGGTAPYSISVDIVGVGITNYTANSDTTIIISLPVNSVTNIASVTIADQITANKCEKVEQIVLPIVDFSSTGIQTNVNCNPSAQSGFIYVPLSINCSDFTFDWSGSTASSLISSGINNDTITLNLIGITTGNYDFQVVVNGGGCARTYNYTLGISNIALPNVISSGINPSILCKSSLPFNGYAIQANFVNGINYNWESSSANALSLIPSNQLNSNSIFVNFAADADTGSYVFNVLAKAGTSVCDTTLTYTVRIVEKYQVASAIDNNQVCVNTSTIVRASGGAVNSYTWRVNGELLNETSASINYTPIVDGDFEFIVTDNSNNSCVISDSVYLKANPIPKPTILIGDKDTLTCYETIKNPVAFTYSFSVDPANLGIPDSIVWTFIDGIVRDTASLVKEYSKKGNYTAKLKVIFNGCVGETQLTVKVCDGFFIPNVFTPNADGVNDGFLIRGIDGNGWKLDVFNRWGNPVYSNLNYKNDWDASSISEGVYYYSLKSPDGTNDSKGWVQILK
jgi:gliding motility-associated-like protein